ncbi:hypothetical protein GAGA_1578 [Paraglaciecola agarilytica NO2]|uniref:Uncharacterized protein n=1 Tax=Paraglaciecola agarilytica NO2 TaxID=1125747 RepID=A0ABQ0I539_9ALTE|nr:hypothetical protein GAGA_1578 [Paraglaciecola agarilytica NO2]
MLAVTTAADGRSAPMTGELLIKKSKIIVDNFEAIKFACRVKVKFSVGI